MPEPTSESRETEMLKRKILQNINNINELAAILRSFKGLDHVPMDDRVELMRLVFTAESKTPRYDLITYLWNFLKILYNNMVIIDWKFLCDQYNISLSSRINVCSV